jgi:uncharacterized protein YhfF
MAESLDRLSDGRVILGLGAGGADAEFGLVDEAFAWIEGEGDRSLASWRDAHVRFFAGLGLPVSDDTLVVLDTFELLWAPG